jgi:hypothetical protein
MVRFFQFTYIYMGVNFGRKTIWDKTEALLGTSWEQLANLGNPLGT